MSCALQLSLHPPYGVVSSAGWRGKHFRPLGRRLSRHEQAMRARLVKQRFERRWRPLGSAARRREAEPGEFGPQLGEGDAVASCHERRGVLVMVGEFTRLPEDVRRRSMRRHGSRTSALNDGCSTLAVCAQFHDRWRSSGKGRGPVIVLALSRFRALFSRSRGTTYRDLEHETGPSIVSDPRQSGARSGTAKQVGLA